MTTAYIGMGANLPSSAGLPAATLAAAAARLADLGRITARSRLYATMPVGIADQPEFVNAVVALETDMKPRQLLDGLHSIEREFGRNRDAELRYGPRTLDLDILLFGGEIVHETGLEIPHPRLLERAFVLIPLHEIAAEVCDPNSGLSVTQWVQRQFPVDHNAHDQVTPFQSGLWRPGIDRDAGDAS